MGLQSFQVKTSSNTQFINITSKVNEFLTKSRIENGICCVYLPHTTGGITINESADPAVVSDMLKELNKIVPFDDNYTHMEGNSAAHIKATLVGTSETIPINSNKLAFGTWQGIFLCEFDGPRTRTVYVQLISE